MRVLVLNAGSSSIKYEVFDEHLESLRQGTLERVTDHRAGFREVLHTVSEVELVGHRIVHGGAHFSAPAVVDDEVLRAIRATMHLAPVHTPINLAGVEAVSATWPGVRQVAVFDTAFHHAMPEHAWRYALPRALADARGMRRYGFHGISYSYVSRRAAELLGRPDPNLIVLHLGNGASVAAIRAGRSIDTSMGMTPLEGLVMGTRAGDLDPSIPLALGRDAEDVLNFQSGLRGLCGDSDLRGIQARTDPEAVLALEIYCYRIRKYIGAYFAALGRVDAVVFTAGVGEHSAPVRAKSCEGLEALGIAIDPVRNAGRGEREIQSGTVKVLVIPTDEEKEIARQALECIR